MVRGGNKFATIHFDGRFAQLFGYNETMESLLDPLHYYWDSFLRTYLHEFSHTIEMRVNYMLEFHKVVSKYGAMTVYDPLLCEKLYLLNKVVINDKLDGVPYEFWEGKYATLHYEAQDGGRVDYVGTYHSLTYGQDLNDDIQYVLYGDDAITVKATAFEGYEFVCWSDGVETAVRQDLNVTQDLHVYAVFKLKE